MSTKLVGYPTALWVESSEVVVLGIAAIIGLALFSDIRERWARPTVVGGAILVFLVIGDVGDGAPTHHPARALVAFGWLLVAAGVDAIRAIFDRLSEFAPTLRLVLVLVCACVGATWCVLLPERWKAAPGRSPWDDRSVQISRGLELRKSDVERIVVTPCQFEHFALMAAWGRPERALVGRATGGPPTSECPRIDIESDNRR
jgi:hypothetical protein